MLLCVGLAINIVNDGLLDSIQVVYIMKLRGAKRRTIGH